MIIKLPVQKQRLQDDVLIYDEVSVPFEIDTSVYSEERWEQNFPNQAANEGLFQYIARVKEQGLTDRVKVTALLKAIYCFVESDSVPTYKDFAKLFNMATPEYTDKLIHSLKSAFELILNSSSVKN